MLVALAQTIGTAGNVGANLALLEDLAFRAAGQGASLLVLPELFLTGYNIGDEVAALAEPADGPSARAIATIARRLGLSVAYGYAERAAEGVYNTAAFIDRSGLLRASYRKTHLWGRFERDQFRAGCACDPFEVDGRRLGLMICYDLEFPELARGLALAGVELAIVMSATSAPYDVVPRHLVPARAYENGMFLAFCNHAGAERGLTYVGGSCIAAPDGSLLADGGSAEALALGDVDFARYAAYRREHRYIGDRRPELYAPLCMSGLEAKGP